MTSLKGYFKLAIVAFTMSMAIFCALASWQLIFPLRSPVFFPFSETYYARAKASEAPERGIYWAQMAIQTAPSRAENWVLLAYCYQREDRTLSDRVIDALRMSYGIGTLSADVHDWRLLYVFSNWNYMPKDLQDFATIEAGQYIRRRSGYFYVTSLQASVPDKEAKEAIGALLLELRTTGNTRYENSHAQD